MRLAYVCGDPGVPVWGTKGCSVHVQEVIRALRREGVQVELFARRVGGAPPADLSDVAIHPLPAVNCQEPRDREQQLLRANREAILRLHQRGPFDAVYERYALWNYAGVAYAQDTEVPGVLEVNAPLISEQSRHRRLVDMTDAWLATRRAFSSASRLLAVSHGVADYLSQFPETEGLVEVVPNGVDPNRFQTPRVSRDSDSCCVGFVGTLRPWHGMSILGRAFSQFAAQHASARLLIVGDGEAREELHDSLSISARTVVQHTGKVAPGEVPGWLTQMDIAVAPYPVAEDFYFSPLKILEYMAAGIPVVASAVGDLPSLVEHERTGILVPPSDADALGQALLHLARHPIQRQQLADAARARVAARHTWHGVAERIIRLLRRRRREVTRLEGVA